MTNLSTDDTMVIDVDDRTPAPDDEQADPADDGMSASTQDDVDDVDDRPEPPRRPVLLIVHY